jgi:DNA-binding Lrp family transcriptional regulator
VARAHLDRLDIRIVRELTQSRTVWPARPGLIASYRQIARAVGVSPGTIRNRVGHLTRSGVLRGIAVYANLTLLGLRSGSYAVEVSPSLRKSEVIDRLSRIPGLVFFENFRGSLLGIGVAYAADRDLEKTLAQIDAVAQSPRGMFSRVTHPPCSVELTQPEWQLLSRLMSGGFRSYGQLARELRASIRTLKRRIAKLDRSGALLTFPQLDYTAITGAVAAGLLVTFRDTPSKEDAKVRVRQLLDDWTTFIGGWEDFEFYRLFLPNVAKAAEVGESVRAVPGVGFFRVEFVDGLIDQLGTLKVYVDRHIDATSRVPAKRLPPRSRPAH